jgi:hypothetical protein
MMCCAAPALEPSSSLAPLPPCTVSAPKTKLKAQPGKFAPGPKYVSANGSSEVQFKDVLDVGVSLPLVMTPVPAAPDILQGHGVPERAKDKKDDVWIRVQMPAPADAVAGSRPLEGWVPVAAVDCPGLALSYDYLAQELLEAGSAIPAEKAGKAKCHALLGLRMLTKISSVTYPLLEVGGTVDWNEPRKAQVVRAFTGAGPSGGKRKGGSGASGVVGALRTLEEKYLRAGTKFACGDAPCIADLSVVPPLLLLNVAGVVLSPAVASYVANFEAHFGEKYAELKAPLDAWVESKKESALAVGLDLAVVGA